MLATPKATSIAALHSAPNAQLPSPPAAVASVLHGCSEPVRSELLSLRDLILTTAAETDGVGAVSEALRWGQAAYLTDETGAGSTIRSAPTSRGSAHDYAVFFICHTTLVDTYKSLFGDTFTYDGDRAILFRSGEQRPENELRECIAIALTYHLTGHPIGR